MPGVAVAPEAWLAGMVVIQRGGLGEVVLSEDEALETLMSNCEDAYGFPPYAAIEGSLRRRNGSDLKQVERAIVASALSGLPASLLRSETMDWSCSATRRCQSVDAHGPLRQGRTFRRASWLSPRLAPARFPGSV